MPQRRTGEPVDNEVRPGRGVRIVPFVHARRLIACGLSALTLAALAGCGHSGGAATGVIPPVRTDSSTAASSSPEPFSTAPTTGPAPSTGPMSSASTGATSGRPSPAVTNSYGIPRPTAVVPGTPDDGDYSDASLSAAAVAYFKALDLSLRRGDEAPYLAVTQVICPCRNLYLPTFEQERKDGATADIDTSVKVLRLQRLGSYEGKVRVHFRAPAYTVAYPDGRKKQGQPGEGELTVHLRVLDRRWQVLEVVK